jgi:hypothetical protein
MIKSVLYQDARMFQHMQISKYTKHKIKNKNHKIISIDADKAFDKNSILSW